MPVGVFQSLDTISASDSGLWFNIVKNLNLNPTVKKGIWKTNGNHGQVNVLAIEARYGDS